MHPVPAGPRAGTPHLTRPRRARAWRRTLGAVVSVAIGVGGLAVAGSSPAHADETWDAPGTTRLVITANAPTTGLVRGMGADLGRNVVYAVTDNKLLHVLDGTTGASLQDPIALPVAPTTNFPVMVDPDSGDVKLIAVGTTTEYGIEHPGNPSLYSVVTVGKAVEGYETPTWSAFYSRLNSNSSATLDETTGDVYVISGDQAIAPADGSLLSQQRAGQVLRIPDSGTNGVIDAEVVFDDLSSADPPQAASVGNSRQPLLDSATGRLYLVSGSPLNEIKVVDVDGFDVVSTTPVAEGVLPRAAALDAVTGRLYVFDEANQVHQYEGRVGTAALTRVASAPRIGTAHHVSSQSLLWTGSALVNGSGVALYETTPIFQQVGALLPFASTARAGRIATGATGKAFVGIGAQSGAGVRGVRVVERMLTPAVTEQPSSIEVTEGDTATFTVAGTGTPAPSIRWQRDAGSGWADLSDGDGITGTASGTLSVPATAAADGSHYRAVLRNQATDWTGAAVPVGALASEAATLTIAAPDAAEQEISVTVADPGPGEFVWSISGGGAPVTMTEAVDAGDHWHSTGAIHPVAITDTRADGPTWSVSGQVSDFTGGVSGRYLGWTPEVVTPGAGATEGAPVASGHFGGDGLTVGSTLASSSAGHAPGTATLGADLDLRLPASTPPGTYSAVLTLTALS